MRAGPLGRLLGGGAPERVVARTALLVGLPLIAVLIAWAATPQPYYTGSDSIRTRGFVQPVAAGTTLCVRGLRLPAQTALVELEILTPRASRPALALTLRAPDGRTVARSRLPRAAGVGPQSKIAFPIAQRPPTPAAVPVEACVTPTERVTFGGTLDIGGAAPTVAGRPRARERIAVWFRPPAGARRSLVGQLPTVVERASLFRPPWVGPWTYYALLALALPLALALVVALLARAHAWSWRRLGAGVFAVALLIGAGWALVTPPFQAPDEQDHFAYVQQLAENGTPASQEPGRSAWSSSLTAGLVATRALAIAEEPDGRPPWLAADERAWAAVDRGEPSRTDGGGATTAATHGPIYYGAMVPAYRLTAGASLWSQLTAVRLLSALLSALTVVLVLLAAREVAPSRPLFAVGAALLVALNPMFTFVGASVNSDIGVNLAAAALLVLLLRAARRGLSTPLAAAIGVTLGVLPLIKGTGYALLVVAVVALAALALRHRDRRTVLAVAVAVGATVAVQAIWAAVAPDLGRTTFTTPGGGSPIAATSLLDTSRAVGSYIWQIVLPPLWFMHDHYPFDDWPLHTIYVVRGWASFGWYAIEFPALVYDVIVAASAATLAAGGAFALRRRDWLRANWVSVVILVAAPVLVFLAVHRVFTTTGQRALVAEMGRYIFPAIGALGVLAAGAAWAWGERWAVRLTTAAVVALMVLTIASQLLTLRGFYT